MNKVVFYGKEAREKVLVGVRAICKAVKVTLGPKGRNVLIAKGFIADYGFNSLNTVISKDGYTVSQAFDLSDPTEKVGINIIKEAAHKTVLQAGDSTTTTCVLAESMIENGMAAIDAGANPIDVKRGMDKTLEELIIELEKMSTPVGGNLERIKQVATVSANSDEEIGELIAKAYESIGDDGIINLEEANGVETKVKIIDGFKIDRGYFSPYFITNQAKNVCELENPYILLYDRNISLMKDIEPILLKTMNEKRPLVIICENIDGEALASLNINNARKAISVCVIQAPSFGDMRREMMEDIAALTGGEFLSDLKGVSLAKAEIRHLGEAKRVVVTKEDAVIIGGLKDKKRREELVNDLQMNKVGAKDENERNLIEQRIGRLNGSVAVIEVGGPTETEMKEKKDRLDDAIRSVKASISDGFVPGGGTAFIRCQSLLAIDGRKSKDYQKGQEIVMKALFAPMLQICDNAGVDGQAKLQEVSNAEGNVGYNAQTDKIEDLVESGIIDATKVLKAAITNAASVAGMLLTAEALICDTF